MKNNSFLLGALLLSFIPANKGFTSESFQEESPRQPASVSQKIPLEVQKFFDSLPVYQGQPGHLYMSSERNPSQREIFFLDLTGTGELYKIKGWNYQPTTRPTTFHALKNDSAFLNNVSKDQLQKFSAHTDYDLYNPVHVKSKGAVIEWWVPKGFSQGNQKKFRKTLGTETSKAYKDVFEKRS